jgi:hypothetical protein
MSVMLHTDGNYMHFVHFLLKLKQVQLISKLSSTPQK